MNGPAQRALADHGAAEQHEREVQLGAALIARPEPAQVVQPGEGALHDPALFAKPRAMLLATSGDHRLHPAPAELTAKLVEVIAAVGEQPLGALAGTPRPAGYRPDGIEQRQQLCDVVAVPAGQADRQRDSVGVGDQMVL